MTTWHITTVFDGHLPENAFTNGLVDELDALDGSAANAPRRQWTISLWRDGTAAQAAKTGLAEAVKFARKHRLPNNVVAVEVISEDELDVRNETPNYPDIVDAVGAAEILDVSRQRVHQLASEHKDFPPALYELPTGRLWTRMSIEGFLHRWDRRPGRPAKRPLGKTAGRRADRTSAASSAEVRTWARQQGYTVSHKGRLPAPVVESFEEAMAGRR